MKNIILAIINMKNIILTIIVVIVIIFIMAPSIKNRIRLCSSGQIEYCTKIEWCRIQGGKYFNSGFGAGHCEYPNQRSSVIK